MQKKIFEKKLVCVIILLFIGASITPITNAINKNFNDKQINKLSGNVDGGNSSTLSFHTFYNKEERQCNAVLSLNNAEIIYNMLEELKLKITYEPYSEETQTLKNEFVDLLDIYGLIPAGSSKSDVLEMLDPSNLKSKPKNTKSIIRATLLQNFVSRITKKITNLQQIFENLLTPQPLSSTATAIFCSITSGGNGITLPVFLLPRPRAIAVWSASEAQTLVGELLTEKGFVASGAQKGTALGFMGIGLTYSFPGENVYGFVGYATYTKVTADTIEYYGPPNQVPVISNENPSDGAEDIPVTLSQLSFRIEDLDGDRMDYTVTTEPNIGSGNGNNQKDGVYNVLISGLEGNTKYSWHVVVDDEKSTVEKTFSFTTKMIAPIVSYPSPEDGSTWIPIHTSQLSFNLKDIQGDLMDYTVETSPNIGSGSGNDVGEGIYIIDVSGLDYQTEYTWYVNVTDGTHWTHEIFKFSTELNPVFNPFDEGWHYRKKITINHNKVNGNLNDFPVLISVIDNDLKYNAQDDGDDILFMDDIGVANRLFHEIEKYEYVNGELIAWVNLPSLSSSVDTILYLYYGNPTCINQQNVNGTWNSDYNWVMHFNEGGTGIRYDSTDNNRDMAPYSYDNNEATTGNIDGADYMIRSENDNLRREDGTKMITDTQGTLEIYFKTSDDISSQQTLVSQTTHNVGGGIPDGGGFYIFFLNSQMKVGMNGISSLKTDDTVSANTWYYFVIKSELASVINIYWNGVQKGITIDSGNGKFWFGNLLYAPYHLRIGNLFYGTNYEPNGQNNIKGTFDELRHSKVARSDAWIKTTYNNINAPSNFFSVGPEETAP